MPSANTWPGLVAHLRADLFRYHGSAGRSEFVSSMLREPGFKLTFWLRVCWYLFDRPAARLGPYWIARLIWSHYRFKYGVHIDIGTDIGPGFYLCHVGGIVVNRRCRIGKNCNLSNDVTIGIKRGGVPEIGDNVYIGPGAKIFGELSIGDRACVGANAVVTKSVPEMGVAVGIPAEVISESGSDEFVNQTEWDAK